MYTQAEREGLRAELIAAAQADPRISGGAVTGSAAVGKEDPWSDIDLAFGVRDASELQPALADFTDRMYARHGALHHLDVPSGAWIYRVFLLPSTLQVDLAFAPAADFGPRAATFKLAFGSAAEPPRAAPPAPERLIGLAWLYALHARSSIARDRLWQAEYMVSLVRDQVLALACLRHGLPWSEGRGLDRLPKEEATVIESALVRAVSREELARAFRAVTQVLLSEIEQVDRGLAERLRPALVAMAHADPGTGTP